MDIGFDPVIYDGKPEDFAGREDKEIRTYNLLEQLGISFQRMDHDPAMNMEACEELDKVMGVTHCKNLFLRNTQKTKFYLLLLPHDKKLGQQSCQSRLAVRVYLLPRRSL